MGNERKDVFQLALTIPFLIGTAIMAALLLPQVREVVWPNPAKVPFREFLFVADELELNFRIDEKLYVNRDEYLVVFAGMARDASGRMLPKETPVEASVVGSRQGLILRGEARGRFYWAVGRHPSRVREELARILKDCPDHDPLKGALLDSDRGPGGIALSATSVNAMEKRFGKGDVSGKGLNKTLRVWQLPQIKVAIVSDSASSAKAEGGDSVSFLKWQGPLTSALRSSGLSSLPVTLGDLVYGADSKEVKRLLGLAESEGTARLCPAMLPQVGETDVFCRLKWDPDAKLAAVPFFERAV